MKHGSLVALLALAVLCVGGGWFWLKPLGAAPNAVVVDGAERGGRVEMAEPGAAAALPLAPNEVRVAAGEMALEEGTEVAPTATGEESGGAAAIADRQLPVVTLEVVAAGTGEHLTGIDLHYVPSNLDTAIHPSGQSWAKLADDESSPLELRPVGRAALSSRAAVIVGARGYAWKRVFLNLRLAGEQRVELEQAGSLRVDYDGVPPQAAQLRLYSDDVPFAEFALENETNVLAGLPPGAYRASIEVGHWFNDPAVMGDQEVMIVAGQEAAVRLLLQVPTISSVAGLSGTLIVPTEWGALDHSVTLQQLTSSAGGVKRTTVFKQDSLPPVPGEAGRYSFEVAALETGVYSLRHSPLDWAQVLEHPIGGTHDYRLVVPAPTDVTVRVVLAGTDETAEGVDRILWQPISAEGVVGGSPSVVTKDVGTSVFSLRVPMGKFSVSTLQRGYATESVDFDATTTGDFVMGVRPTAVCLVELRSGGALVPLPKFASVELLCPTGDESRAYLGTKGTECWFTVPSPGPYAVLVPAVEGYLRPEPVSVDLVLGEERSIVVELTPK